MINEFLKEYYYNLYKKFYMNAGIMECFVKALPFISVSNLDYKLTRARKIQIKKNIILLTDLLY
ncbi:hypothetical protein [Clostridium tyrobutyricum]|uniref:hypothetical protein n=1 Tax=Clostridium tyrobutyricum TaxID=1519 RepID=UPI0011CBA172|nr:hypothetical protein [Clostridium tyrobutyricum]